MDDQAQLGRLGLFDARVPRYTSYPTAPHFSDEIGPDDFAAWTGAIGPGAQISLYLHVPFCRRLCWFCACRTQGTSSDEPVNAYAELLIEELRLLRDRLPEGITLSRLHWGGGTPTMLAPAAITRLAKAIAATIPFGPDAEFSVEIDPNEIDAPRLDALAEAGMNRASIGVQDFDEAIQKIIGRDQTYDATRTAVDLIRARGVRSLNADILYGLPDQSVPRLSDSVQKLLSLSPDRVALYGYAHVPWMARRQVMIPSDRIPTPVERLALFDAARHLFLADGYDEIGIDHFARPGDGLETARHSGRLRRNFQGYTDDTADVLIGLGASAISRFPQGYAQNAVRTSDYQKAIRSGQFATIKGHRFTPDDNLRARIIEMLMCDFRVDRASLTARYEGCDTLLTELFDKAEERFPGMLERDITGISIPARARPLTRMIARAFDAYDLSKSGHSPAV